MELKQAKASVYADKKGVFYLKISFDTGSYISGITVRKSVKYGGWWVQMPYFRDPRTGDTKRYIEFDQESPDQQKIERLCIEAVETYKSSQLTPNSYIDPRTLGRYEKLRDITGDSVAMSKSIRGT